MPQKITITAEYTIIDHTRNLGATIDRALGNTLAVCPAISISVKYEPEDDDDA